MNPEFTKIRSKFKIKCHSSSLHYRESPCYERKICLFFYVVKRTQHHRSLKHEECQQKKDEHKNELRFQILYIFLRLKSTRKKNYSIRLFMAAHYAVIRSHHQNNSGLESSRSERKKSFRGRYEAHTHRRMIFALFVHISNQNVIKRHLFIAQHSSMGDME